MTNKEYQQWAANECYHFIAPCFFREAFAYNALGVAGEAGEVVEVAKKAMRQNPLETFVLTRDTRAKLIDESGDVLWYLVNLFEQIGTNLDEVIEENVRKLKERYPNEQ